MAHDEEYCSSLASVRSNSDESEGEFHDSEMEAEVAHNCYSSTTHLQNDDILSERKYSNSVGDTSPREITGCGTPSPLAVKNALSRYPPKQQERKETNYRLYESELDRTTRLKHASKCHRSKHKLKNRNLGEIRDNRESGRGANRTRANESKGLASGDEGPVPCSESSPGSGEGVSGKEPASSRFTLWVFDDGTIVKKRV